MEMHFNVKEEEAVMDTSHVKTLLKLSNTQKC